MHRVLKSLLTMFFFTGIYFLTSGSLAVVLNNINYVFEIPKNIDSMTINKLYSEKNIKFVNPQTLEEQPSRIFVNIKPKPLNPSIISNGQTSKEINLSNLSLSKNFDIKNLTKAKLEFIETLLPLISYENQKILFDRKKILNLRNNLLNKKTLTNQELSYLRKISNKYKVKSDNKHKIDLIEDLLISVDIIPNSIVLAQAANESGWGTSRFAKEYNAIFGEYTYDFNKGVIPLKREEGKKHLVKAFTSYNKSVESYFKNINTHYAYEGFRSLRKLMREKNNFSNVDLLVSTLDSYAEDEKYIKTINLIIKTNKLDQFDRIIYNHSES